jgi:signal transduction histidine kinase
MALSCFLMPLVAVPSLRVLSMVAIPLLVLGYLCLYVGIADLLGRGENRRALAGLYGAFLVAYYYYAFVSPGIMKRTAVLSIVTAILFLVMAHRLFRHREANLAATTRFTGSVFLGYGLFSAARIIPALLAQGPDSYLTMAPIHVAAFVLPLVASSLWTFGFILMVNQRLNNAVKEERDALRTLLAERKLAEARAAELEARNRQLLKAESLGRMAGAVAHHFNNHLQAVLGNLDLAAVQPEGSDPSAYLAQAREAVERASHVSGMMLAYLGRNPREQKTLSLAGLCVASLPKLREDLPPGVSLATDLPLPGPVVRANPEQVRGMLANLVTNAWEALDGAPGAISLRAGVCAASSVPAQGRFPVDWEPLGGDLAYLEVADAAGGIPAEDLERIFDPFYSTKFTGRGLGLPMVLGAAQAHGGAVTVASRTGEGSVFRVYLPIENKG